MKRFTLSVDRTAIACIDIAKLDAYRATVAISQLGEEFKINSFVARDMVECDHGPFIYWTNGIRTLSHEKKGDIVTIYEERCKAEKEKQP